MGKLTNLKSFIAYGNNLSGPVPSSIGSCKKMYNFILNNNALSGRVPEEIGNCTRLENLDLGANKLTGSIPNSLGACQKLLSVYLYSNSLTGCLPPSLGRVRSLEYIDVSDNALAGCIPDSFCNLSSLRYLYLARNHLEGPLPEQLGAMRSLRVFNMACNEVTGKLPKSIVSMKRLRHFDVSENDIDKISAQELREGLSSLKLLVSFNVGGSSSTPRTRTPIVTPIVDPGSPQGMGDDAGAAVVNDAVKVGGGSDHEDWSTGEGVRGNSFRARRSPGNHTRQAEFGLRQRHSNVGDRRGGAAKTPGTPQDRKEKEEQTLELA
jgi:hypothetical protein